MCNQSLPLFDFRQIRPRGSWLITSGGKAPGPKPLIRCLQQIQDLLDTKMDGEALNPIECHDLECFIAEAVLAGGIRRAAMISLFSLDDEAMLNAKGEYEIEVIEDLGRYNGGHNLKVSKFFNGERLGDNHQIFVNAEEYRQILRTLTDKKLSLPKLPWYYFYPERARANNSMVIHRGVITEEVFKQKWDVISKSASGEPGIAFSNDVSNYGYNPCLTGDTWVLTESGYQQINDLVDRPFKVVVDGELYASDGFWSTGVKPVYQVLLKNGLSLCATLNHQIYTKNGWKPIGEIEVGEDVGVTLHHDNAYYVEQLGCSYGSYQSFHEVTKFYQWTDALRLGQSGCLMFSPLASVTAIGEKEVFDCHVEEVHEFSANGIRTHNCMEASLRSYQFCNLETVNVSNLTSQADLNARVKACAFIGTLQASYTDFHYLREVWKENTEKDALIGVSMTGVASCKVSQLDVRQAAEVAVAENERVASLIGIRPASRITLGKPEGTGSLVLGTSSGFGAWHSKYYIRNIRVNKDEAIYAYLLEKVPELVADEVLGQGAVISIPIQAPEGAIFRNESPLDALERIRFFYNEWVLPGHREGMNTHNISATISIRDEAEWKAVGEWVWQHRDSYNGLSFLPYDGGHYVQMPFEECGRETYEQMIQYVKQIDLSEIHEAEDMTELQQVIACAGGQCEV